MSELKNPRVAGLGLAPALASHDMNRYARDSRLDDALRLEAPAALRTAGLVSGQGALDWVSRRVRGAGVGVGRAAAESAAPCYPSRPAARA